jgi:importin-4
MGDHQHQQVANTTNTAVHQLAALLRGLTQPDTETIRTAEAHLKPILKDANNMQYFWMIIADENHQFDVATRHVATIVLRKRLVGHFASYDITTQELWQHQVLKRALVEKERAIRTGLMGVAASLFKSGSNGNSDGPPSPIALAFLETAVHGDTHSRELAFVLLNEMTETIGNHWKDHVTALYHVFAQVLQNANDTTGAATAESTNTITAAVEALGALIAYWAENPEEVAILLPLLPSMLRVSMQSEDLLRSVLDVLYDLAYSSQTVAQLPVMIEFSTTILMNKQLDIRIRDSAALVIATCAEAKPKTFLKYEVLLGQVLDALFQLMQDSDESAAGALLERHNNDDDDDDDEDDDPDKEEDVPTETSMAQGTLDMIACEMPTKHIWPALYGRCLDRMRSNDPKARKAGVAGLGVIAEGCSECLARHLPEAIPMVLAAARDAQSQHVRECACFCLGQMSEHCQPEILSYAEQILPTIFHLLDDATPSVQTVSCYVLEIFCERLEPKVVRPVLDNLVKKLAYMLQTATKRNVQEMAIAAMAATAVAAEQEFIPYLSNVAQLLLPFLLLPNEKQFGLRGRALECMGHMAIAVGREAFRPYFETTMQSALDGLNKDSTDLQEFAFAVFANLAKTMKEEMAPALNDLVHYLINVIEQDEGQLEPAAPSDNDQDGFAGLDDSDDEDAGENLVLHVRTAFLDVKKGAITALGEMAAHCGTHFCPFLEATMQSLQEAAGNWHPLIKSEAADAFPSLIVPSISAYHHGTIEWKKGDATNTMSSHTNAILLAVLQEELKLVKDEEPGVVTKALEALSSLIELCGPAAFAAVQSEAMQAAHDVLAKATPSQTPNPLYETPDEPEGEDEDDSEQHVLLQTASDLVVSFCKVTGEGFCQFLPQFLPLIVEYTKQSRPPVDRGMAYGTLGEIAQEVGTGILPYWQSIFLPTIMAGLADSDHSAARNTAFLCGMCCESLGMAIVADYPRLLQGLSPIFGLDAGHSVDTQGCVDNAAAAIARMIMAAPDAVSPLGQVLDAFCKALPLKSDFSENETVYKCLTGLMQMKHAALSRAHVERIVTAACSEGSNVEANHQDLLRQAAMIMQQ